MKATEARRKKAEKENSEMVLKKERREKETHGFTDFHLDFPSLALACAQFFISWNSFSNSYPCEKMPGLLSAAVSLTTASTRARRVTESRMCSGSAST